MLCFLFNLRENKLNFPRIQCWQAKGCVDIDDLIYKGEGLHKGLKWTKEVVNASCTLANSMIKVNTTYVLI